MKPFGRIEDRHGVDEPDYEPATQPAKPLYAISQGTTAATVIGGALLVIASFLPLDEPRGLLARVASNTIVQQEEWLVPVFGAIIAVAALNGNTFAAPPRVTSTAWPGWSCPRS